MNEEKLDTRPPKGEAGAPDVWRARFRGYDDRVLKTNFATNTKTPEALCSVSNLQHRQDKVEIAGTAIGFFSVVIPAKAGIQSISSALLGRHVRF